MVCRAETHSSPENPLSGFFQVSISPNGNLTSDGRYTYTWDGENRLDSVLSNGMVVVANVYDHMNRRIVKVTATEERTFLYDGWNAVREIAASGESVSTNYYTWGLDLSGTLQGAGGVGGLLAVNCDGAEYYPAFDANGNITEYVDESGTVRAHREYDAFGDKVSQSGDLSDSFRFWFSTKYHDDETGFYYYGYRFYAPELGRWLNRDPIEEDGGLILYGFVENNPINQWDDLGMATHLTVEEAKQLACAINKWLPFTAPGNFISKKFMADKDWGPTIRFVKNYMSKSGRDLWVDWSDLKNMLNVRNANQNARKFFESGGTGHHIENTATDEPYNTAIGRVLITYRLISRRGAMKATFETEKFTFSDTTEDQRYFNAPFDNLNYFAGSCCWKGGEAITDFWMADLEKYGYAKSFRVKTVGILLPMIGNN